ncbi:MAG: phenylalanine--tRNA ligase subunit beta [Terrimicrobiaceae bacterium]
MKVSLDWLADYIDFPELSVLEDTLTRAGLTVENIEKTGADFPHVVVAQILESAPHPNADRLSVCQVDDGSGTPRQIVCGAKNYQVGDKVPLALPGAVLPGDFRIKTGKLRGVESQGMMCSGKELGIDSDAQGLLILPSTAVPGTSIGELFPPSTVLELEVTPNRPDWLGHVGVAREIGALTGRTLRLPKTTIPATVTDPSIALIEANDDCSFYSVWRLSGVRVGPSPDGLRRRIESIGLRSINNVVDATNYVMMETGQPLHAFDSAHVHGRIHVRHGRPGETIEALDGKNYPAEGHLLIADENGPLAIAGIMGGSASGVTGSTVDVLLESAVFRPGRIRASARTLGLFTDSSYRFERGVDPGGVLAAAARVVDLLGQAVGTAGQLVTAGSLPTTRHTVSLRNARCRTVLGAEIPDSDISQSLTAFGLRELEDGHWEIPSHRLDLEREADLIEEVARAVGIDRIPSKVVGWTSAASQADQVDDFAATLRSRLSGGGFHEARHGALVSAAMASEYEGIVRLRNPLGEDQAILRPSLVPGLLQSVARNLRNGEPLIRLFEIGKTYHAEGPEETLQLAMVMTGQRSPANWRDKEPGPADLFDLKGSLTSIVGAGCEWIPTPPTPARPLQAKLVLGEISIGTAWQLSPSSAREIDARHPVVACELNLTALLAATSNRRPFSPPPSHPSTSRDIALVAPLELAFRDVARTIRQSPQPLLEKIEAVDVYQDPTGERLPKDRKSLAISLTFRAADRTLLADEVNALVEGYKARLRETLQVAFRE